MAIQSLTIKDGTGSLKYLAVESSSYGFIPVHQITSSTSSPIYITASSANPLPVTGSISVDVVVGDIINVTASSTAPVYVTGAITNTPSLQAVYSTTTYTANTFPFQLVGTNGTKANLDASGRLAVTSSQTNPIWITGSTVVDIIAGDVVNVTSSTASPVYVSGTLTVNTASSTVTIANSSLVVTSSLVSPIYAYAYSPPVTTVTASSVTSFSWTTVASGTFNIASGSSTRRGLTLFNPGPYNLYVALSTAGGTTHGFTILNTASAPSQYSFIVYPSGTYTADPTTVGVYHGGYFISSSINPPGLFISAIS